MRRVLRLALWTVALTLGPGGCTGAASPARPEAPAVVHVATEPTRPALAASPLPRRSERCGEGPSARPVELYLDEMRGFMLDPNEGANTSAAKALALLGEARAADFLRDHVAASNDGFALAALVLIDDEGARRTALSMLPGLDESELTMVAYGFERRPDPEVIRRVKAVATASTNEVEVRFARALLASMGVEYLNETAQLMKDGEGSRDAVFAARSLLRTHPREAVPILEAVLKNPTSDSFDLAGSAFGLFPEYVALELLLGARAVAESQYDKIWLDYAIVAKCRRG